jgi:hypothetical protein
MAPKSGVSPDHQFKVPSGGEEFIRFVVRRNAYVFFWKNINDIPMLMKHCLGSVTRRIRRCRVIGISARVEIRSFFAALKRLPVILRRKLRATRMAIRTDRDVFNLVAPREQEKESARGLKSGASSQLSNACP